MREDFKSKSLKIFQEIVFHKERLGQLRVEAMEVLDVLGRSSMEREEVERLREVASMAIFCVEEVVVSKDNSSRRCKWWNRGFCKEKERCQFSHLGEDCKEHLRSASCTTQGCKLRHRRKCRYWALKEGCHRGVECEYTHIDKTQQENETKDVHKMVQQKETKTVEKFDQEVQTEKIQKNSEACRLNTGKNELFVEGERLFCILNRETCTDEDWEVTQEQAEESDMDREEFLETMAKVLEGHLRLMRRQEQNKPQEVEAENKHIYVQNDTKFVFSESMLDEFEEE